MTRAPNHAAADGRRPVEESNARTSNPDAVRNALCALATGTAPSERPAHRETIADATAATECAVEAAAFLDDGRLPELARAVAAARDDAPPATADASPAAAEATTEGASSLADRGAAALETLRRLDAAARSASERAPAADHFHPARGTVLPQTGQPTDR